MHIEPTGARDRDEAEMDVLVADGFPAFITADPSVKPVVGRVREHSPHLDIDLLDDGCTTGSAVTSSPSPR